MSANEQDDFNNPIEPDPFRQEIRASDPLEFDQENQFRSENQA